MSVSQRALSGVGGDTLYSSLNMSGDKGRAVSSVYGDANFIYTLSEELSEKLIEIIQDYFNSYSLTKTYQQNLAKVNKEVIVLDEFAPDTVSLPQIVVQAMPADNFPLSLGNNLGRTTYMGHFYDVFGGRATFKSTLAIYDGSLNSCKKLVDILFLGFSYYIKKRLEAIQIWPEVKISFSNPTKMAVPGSAVTTVGSEMYVSKFSFNISTDWRQFFEIVGPDVAGMKHTGDVEDSTHEFEIDTE